MSRFFAIVIVFLIFSNCSNNSNTQTISGDLYYTWLKLGSFYGQPDSLLQAYRTDRKLGWYSDLFKSDSIGTAYMQMLERNQLLVSPFIYLRTDDEKTLLIFMDEDDYSQFTEFQFKELLEKEQKVRVEVDIEQVWEKTYICRKLKSIELTTGVTLQNQRKFKVEDYR